MIVYSLFTPLFRSKIFLLEHAHSYRIMVVAINEKLVLQAHLLL